MDFSKDGKAENISVRKAWLCDLEATPGTRPAFGRVPSTKARANS